MREQTFPYDHDVLARFPGARSYERGQGRITYLAERAGTPYLLIVPTDPTDRAAPAAPADPSQPARSPLTVTVLQFENEQERGTYLTTRDDPAPAPASA